MRTKIIALGFALSAVAACANPTKPVTISPVATAPEEPTEHGNYPLPPLVDPGDRAENERAVAANKEQSAENTIWSGYAILRQAKTANVIGSVSVAPDQNGARLSIVLNAKPSEYLVDISSEASMCNAQNITLDHAGTLSIADGAGRGTLEVIVPDRRFDGDYENLAGRALMIRQVNQKNAIACGSIEVMRGDPDEATAEKAG